jgi:hypothetical protein
MDGVMRRRLEVQGVEGYDDATLARIEHPLRFAPGLCAAVAALGTALAAPAILLALAAIAAVGAVLPHHPFEYGYLLLRRSFGAPELPPNGAPRRFACALASVWLVVTAGLFIGGLDVAGYILGSLLVAVALLVTTTHICIPSMVFRVACRRPLAAARPA